MPRAKKRIHQVTKAYRIPKPKPIPVPSGADLGAMARNCLVKSASSIIELARIVNQAYKTYYLAGRGGRSLRAKRGRSTQRVKTKDGLAWANWSAFLNESGYQMPKHHKLLRTLAKIGEYAVVLEKKSANLPNSIEALGVITSNDVKKAGALEKLLDRVTPECTAKDAKEIKFGLLPRRESARVRHLKTLKVFSIELHVTEDSILAVALNAVINTALGAQLNIADYEEFDGRLTALYEELDKSSEMATVKKLIADVRLQEMTAIGKPPLSNHKIDYQKYKAA